MSVKTLMLLSIFLTVTVGFTATIGFMMWQWMAQQDSLAKNISARLLRCSLCRSVRRWIPRWLPPGIWSNSATALRDAGISDRQSLNQLLIHYLAAHPQFLSMSMAFEPNAFDHQDAAFAGQSGRILPDAMPAMSTAMPLANPHCTC